MNASPLVLDSLLQIPSECSECHQPFSDEHLCFFFPDGMIFLFKLNLLSGHPFSHVSEKDWVEKFQTWLSCLNSSNKDSFGFHLYPVSPLKLRHSSPTQRWVCRSCCCALVDFRDSDSLCDGCQCDLCHLKYPTLAGCSSFVCFNSSTIEIHSNEKHTIFPSQNFSCLLDRFGAHGISLPFPGSRICDLCLRFLLLSDLIEIKIRNDHSS